MFVVVGETDLTNFDGSEQTIEVYTIEKYGSYDPVIHLHDIAVVGVSIEFSIFHATCMLFHQFTYSIKL